MWITSWQLLIGVCWGHIGFSDLSNYLPTHCHATLLLQLQNIQWDSWSSAHWPGIFVLIAEHIDTEQDFTVTFEERAEVPPAEGTSFIYSRERQSRRAGPTWQHLMITCSAEEMVTQMCTLYFRLKWLGLMFHQVFTSALAARRMVDK